jgi:hypothetical protein
VCGVGADGMKDEGREFEGGEGGDWSSAEGARGDELTIGRAGPWPVLCSLRPSAKQTPRCDGAHRHGPELRCAACCVPHVTAGSSELKRAPIGVCGVQDIDEPWRERA